MKKPVKYSPEVRERAVRLVGECRASHLSQWATIESIAPTRQLPCTLGARRVLREELYAA